MESNAITSPLDSLPDNIKTNLDTNLCVCNEVPKRIIINAIINGATTVAEVKTKTYATMGVGCCTQQIEKLIKQLCPPSNKEQ